MEALKFFFPFSFYHSRNQVQKFVVTLVMYAIVSGVAALVLWLPSLVPLIGWLFRLVGSLVGLYISVGVILTILSFFDIIE